LKDGGLLYLKLLFLQFFHEFSKLLGILICHLTQNFSVDGNFFVSEFFDEGAVFFAAYPESGIETKNPKLSHGSLFVPAVAVGIFSSLEKSFLGGAIG